MKGPIAIGTIRTSIVLGLRLLVQAATLLLLARLLGPDRFGVFAGIAALAAILGTLSTFGTHLVLLGEVSKNAERRRNILAYALPTTLVMGLVLLAVYLASCVYFVSEWGTPLYVLLLLGGAEIVLQPLILLGASEQHGLGRVAGAQMLAILPLAMRLTIAVAIWAVAPSDPLGVYANGYALASVVALILVICSLPARWPSLKEWRWPSWIELRTSAGFAVIGITKAAPAELDKVLAARLLPLASAGVYAAAARVIAAITVPVTAMTLSALPRLFREGQGDGGRASHLVRWMFMVSTGYSIALATGLWFAAPLLDWAFGRQYHGISQAVRWLCFAIPGMSMRLVAGNVLMAMGKPWGRFGFEGFGLLVLVSASVLMVRHLGTIGMPLALICSEWGMAVVGIFLLSRPRFRMSGNDRHSRS